jgi:murein DD-endopeptidase MepM/ murein hydrolase activator NlpD
MQFNPSLSRTKLFIIGSLSIFSMSSLLNFAAVRADDTNSSEVSKNEGSTSAPKETEQFEKKPDLDSLNHLVEQDNGKNRYVDTKNYEPPSRVVVIGRQSHCQTVIERGQMLKGECELTHSRPSRTEELAASSMHKSIEPQPKSERSVFLRKDPDRFSHRLTPPPVSEVATIPLNRPLREQSLLSTAPLVQAYPQLTLELVPLEYSRATIDQTTSPMENRTSLIFPLPIPGVITSAFGWRIHPITGVARLHAGTDIAAAEGTPVLAAYPGQVETAGWVQGYGLMISLLHENRTQESRYGHLSQIYVQPGEWVEQGVVIGRVGSTGMATGPHLHFEWRHLTASGSIPVDAGTHLEYAMNNLINSLRMAQQNNSPNNG